MSKAEVIRCLKPLRSSRSILGPSELNRGNRTRGLTSIGASFSLTIDTPWPNRPICHAPTFRYAQVPSPFYLNVTALSWVWRSVVPPPS